jgi:ribokinase
MYDIITLGSAVQDITVWSQAFSVRPAAQACFLLGGKFAIDAPTVSSGGGATNVAVACAQLGLHVGCIARVGRDLPGKLVQEELRRYGVSNSFLQMANEATGLSIILTAPKGARTALVHRGASVGLRPRSIPWKRVNTGWLYLTNLEGNTALAKAAFSHATKRNIRIAWNPGAQECLPGTKTSMRSLLKYADVLLFNRDEASAVVGSELHDPIKTLFARLTSLAPRAIIVLTDGPKGAWVRHGRLVVELPAIDVEAKSTVGAGDAFGGAFIAGLITHKDDWVSAARLAMLNATSVVQQIGAKKGLLRKHPTAKQLGQVPVRIHEWF